MYNHCISCSILSNHHWIHNKSILFWMGSVSLYSHQSELIGSDTNVYHYPYVLQWFTFASTRQWQSNSGDNQEGTGELTPRLIRSTFTIPAIHLTENIKNITLANCVRKFIFKLYHISHWTMTMSEISWSDIAIQSLVILLCYDKFDMLTMAEVIPCIDITLNWWH